MLAATLTGPRRWTVGDVPDPEPAAGEVLLRTEIAAICGSDLHVAGETNTPQPPGFPGHEAVGVVLDSRTDQFAAGDRVLCVPPAATARCFAELQVLPADALVALPADAPAERFVLAQQLGTAIFAMKRFWPAGSGTGRTAAVLGAGPAGLAFVQLLVRAGFEHVLVSDTSPRRLAAALALGAATAVHAPDEDALSAALDLTGGAGVDLVIESAGRDATRHQAMRMVRVDGRIGLFGLEERAGMSPYPLAEVFRRRPTIEMVWGAQFEPGLASFIDAVDLVAACPAPLLSHRLPLTEIAGAFALAAEPGASVKVALTPA